MSKCKNIGEHVLVRESEAMRGKKNYGFCCLRVWIGKGNIYLKVIDEVEWEWENVNPIGKKYGLRNDKKEYNNRWTNRIKKELIKSCCPFM